MTTVNHYKFTKISSLLALNPPHVLYFLICTMNHQISSQLFTSLKSYKHHMIQRNQSTMQNNMSHFFRCKPLWFPAVVSCINSPLVKNRKILFGFRQRWFQSNYVHTKDHSSCMQCRINNSSKCSNCCGPRAFGALVALCVTFFFTICKDGY